MPTVKVLLLSLLAAVSVTANALPVTYDFQATILDVSTDAGSASYSGTLVGDTFSGSLRYSTNPADAFETGVDLTSPPAIESKWKFNGGTFGGTLTDGSTLVNTDTMSLSIDSDFAVETQQDADFFNSLLALVGNPLTVAPGDLFDAWDTESFNGITGPGDGVAFGVSLVSFDESLYTGLNFEPHPLSLTSYDVGLFFLEERIGGQVVFEAFGILEARAVPEPGSLTLLAFGLLCTAAIRRSAGTIALSRSSPSVDQCVA